MAPQQNRFIRFLMILMVVVLTIFIYASYYSNPAMTIPTRVHSTAALIATVDSDIYIENIEHKVINSRNNKSDDKGGGSSGSGDNSIVSIRKSISYKNMDNSLISSSNNHQNSNEIKEQNRLDIINTNSDNTSKTVKLGSIASIINNADKILKNLTITSTVNTMVTSLQKQRQQDQDVRPKSQHNDNSVPQSPSSTAIRIGNQNHNSTSISITTTTNTTNLTLQHHIDLLNGIPTGKLYESGHLDVNPNLCVNEGEQLRLLIMITSAPSHRDARLAIRQTWGHFGTRRDIAIAFILGKTLNPTIEESLNTENYIYGDLIRGHFIDSYNNLTLKTISVLEWVDRQCPLAQYVLKTDDDMFINVPKLLSFIDKQLQKKEKRTIYGRLAKKWKPIRNKKSKYYVSPGQFSQTIFPQFTTGPAYLMTSDIIHDLYVTALQQTYLKLEDVFTTGIVAQLLDIKRIHVNEFLNRRIAFNPCNIRKAISVHMIKSNEQFDLWKKLLDTSTKCK